MLDESHPRILAFQGVAEADIDDYLVLEYHSNGDLWTYLLNNVLPPLSTRIRWALEIAEGIAYLHSKSIVWTDPHLSNVLITKDMHVVLADFAYAVVSPDFWHEFVTMPPPVFTCPRGFLGMTPNRIDIFGFGVILYVLVNGRFPWFSNLNPSWEEQLHIYIDAHDKMKWDTIDDEKVRERFGGIVEKCFTIKYTDGCEMFNELKQVCATWFLEEGEEENNHHSSVIASSAPAEDQVIQTTSIAGEKNTQPGSSSPSRDVTNIGQENNLTKKEDQGVKEMSLLK
ncbi:kinase-like domain-containing protein [Lentinula raphanica]|nr:kinase-like domain-containing protein [Lentinula raphanica]